MKGILFFCFLAAFLQNSLPAVAQGILESKGGDGNNDNERITFSGKVTESAGGMPLVGASIYFSDLKLGAVTDAKGMFLFANVPKGHHLVEVSYVGYGSHSEYVDIKSDTRKDFVLAVEVVEHNEVVVTGVSKATQIRKMPTPITVIKKADIVQNVSANLIDAIARKPGISQISTGQAISKPVIRGLGYNRVVVVNDGVRQEGQQWGDEHGIEVDEYSVNKIEILKGPGSIIYGSDAMAGVVNIITNVPVPEGTVKGNVIANYQTNSRLRGFGANIAGNENGFNWNAYGSYKAAADYGNKFDGRVFNSKFNENTFGGYIGYNGKWGFSHLIASNYELNTGIVEGERNDLGQFIKSLPGGVEKVATDDDFNSVSPQVPYQTIKHFKLVSDNSFNIGNGRLALNVGGQRNQRIEFGNADVPAEKSLYFDLKTITYSSIYSLKMTNGWNTSFGISGMVQNNSNKGTEVLIPEYNLFDIGGFAFSQKSWDKVSISGGLRFDSRSLDSKSFEENGDVKFHGFKKEFSNFSGSAGVSYSPTDALTLKFNAARGFRAPSIPELASNGVHEGTFRYEYGNPDLKSETSLQFDAAVELNTKHVSLTVNAFNNAINNFIFYRKLASVNGGDSLVNVNGTDIPAYMFNQQKATLTGAELVLDIHPHPLDWLHFENTFSYVKGRFKDPIEGTRNIPFIPAARLLSELKGEFFRKGKTLRNLFLKAEMDNVFAQNDAFTAYNTETPTPAYVLFNAGLGTDIVSRSKTLFSIYFNAMNIGDVAYQNHLSRLKYAPENPATGRVGVYNMGRNFSVKVNVPLEFKKG
jgi:iron complex outermembrane recepter protein